jgi:hypothetical protein
MSVPNNSFCFSFMRIFLIFFIFSFILPGCKDSRSGELEKMISEVNQKCPKMLDPETRIDGIELRQPDTLVYKYTLVNLNVQNLDTHRFRIEMWPGILSMVRLNPSMEKLRKDNIIIQYHYKDKAGKNASVFTVRSEDYRK